jgi:hypothetical protein
MFVSGTTVLPAWREFRSQVLPGHVGAFVLFLLLQIVFGIGFVIASGMLGCLTCCIGMLPYLSSVLTLPLALFMRCYPIYFLQQFGPAYVIINEDVMPVVYGFPVIELADADARPQPQPPSPPQGDPRGPQV